MKTKTMMNVDRNDLIPVTCVLAIRSAFVRQEEGDRLQVEYFKSDQKASGCKFIN